MNNIYNEIRFNGDRYKDKINLFFDLPKHGLHSLYSMPEDVVSYYLKLHKRKLITREDIFKFIKYDFENSRFCNTMETNILGYLEFYIELNKLNTKLYYKRNHGNDLNIDDEVNSHIDSIFSTRFGKLFLLGIQ